jgi:hypothetical protein
MTQIYLPPYRGPQSPLDLVAIEIIFGRLFEACRHTSQAASTKTSIGDDTRPPKKTHAPMLKTILTPRYLIIFTCCYKADLHTDHVIAYRKYSEGRSSKHDDRSLVVPQVSSPATVAPAPPL